MNEPGGSGLPSGPTEGRGSAAECAAAIRGARSVLVICHVDPDGDAIGSLLAMGWFLEGLGIDHVLACAGPEPSRMRFLPRTRPIVATVAGQHDLILTVDCNSLDRLGDIYPNPNLVGVPIVNIDHHVTNTMFGAVNWIEPRAGATAEMVYLLGETLGVPLSAGAATCLLTGIVTDTWAFRTPSTTARTLELANHAIRAGADLNDIVARTIEARSFASLQLWARVIANAQLEDGIVWAEVRQEDFRAVGATRDGQNGLVNFLLSAKEARVAVLLTETAERVIDISLRSHPGVDVSQTAVRLGGGGHPQAAGLTLKAPLAEARAAVKTILVASLAEQDGRADDGGRDGAGAEDDGEGGRATGSPLRVFEVGRS